MKKEKKPIKIYKKKQEALDYNGGDIYNPDPQDSKKIGEIRCSAADFEVFQYETYERTKGYVAVKKVAQS